MNITAQMVKELRDKTGAGMMDAKKALVEVDGDMDKAAELLRQKGIASAEKKMGRIDMTDAERQIMTAFNKGVNYFDTAFIYPGSEAAIGEVFEKNNIRDKVKIATKLPHYLMNSMQIHYSLNYLFTESVKSWTL